VDAAGSRDSANRSEKEFLGQARNIDLPVRGDPGIIDISVGDR
jgi:hypothetical protein